MAEPTVSEMMDALVDIVRGVGQLGDNVVYPPPEEAPHVLSAWLDYGTPEVEFGQFEVVIHRPRITIAVDRRGSYPHEYRLIADHAQLVRKEIAANGSVLAREAMLVGLEVGPVGGAAYGEQGARIVACQITCRYETKEDYL